MAINTVVISGNLTRDAEVKSTSTIEVVTFTVAVNERRKGANGEWEDYANFFDCTAFGERYAKFSLSKGTKVTVQGRLRWSQWEKDGQKRSKVDIVVDHIEFMSRKDDAPKQMEEEDIPF